MPGQMEQKTSRAFERRRPWAITRTGQCGDYTRALEKIDICLMAQLPERKPWPGHLADVVIR